MWAARLSFVPFLPTSRRGNVEAARPVAAASGCYPTPWWACMYRGRCRGDWFPGKRSAGEGSVGGETWEACAQEPFGDQPRAAYPLDLMASAYVSPTE
ncbi:hypothetical protein K505DRAFT_87055 [Melanomma pulvis-pyrius CBS 109.77]|uniref:Uncharacterized protein n=1 Tax=Melanomma pulvis-pyrius CBS 109.77 TaxID=1314802 RepID=A0A6A6X0N2_9PLEO|nr:hypothetical protein K505DRAFT_87055 [Melanomma pulvis-pyrius CBS 109.77]